MLKKYKGPRGQVVRISHESKILKGNPLKDPYKRDVALYLPADYAKNPKKKYPLMMDIVGFTGSGFSHLNWRAFDENVPEKVDRLIHEKKMGPTIIVFPDCFTSLGGNQYINSSAIGRYEDYLIDEVLPLVEKEVRVLKGRKYRAIFGKSSGGYGALMHGLTRPDIWGAVASHSGDLYFEYCYRTIFPLVCNELAKHNYSIKRFLKAFWKKQKNSMDEVYTLMLIAMAATYDPDPKTALGFHFPVDLYSGEIDEKRWKRWLRFDPVCLVEKYAANLKKLNLLYFDCGNQDQFHLHFGARIFVQKLKALKIKHTYEEFEDNHSAIDYRMDKSLPLLYKAMMGSKK